MINWDHIYDYMLNYPALVWDITPFRYLTISMFLCLLIFLISRYIREKSQNYTHNFLSHTITWISGGVYHVASIIHGVFIAKDTGLAPEDGYWKLLAPICGGVALAIAFFLERLGHNLICWHLGTPLWPWNPFVSKPSLEKIVAKNQRANRKAWAIAERKKRSEGKRFSDD